MKKLIKKLLREDLETRWVSGFGLDNDQILAIITSDYSHWTPYYYNKLADEFIPVVFMHKYDINEFDCNMDDLISATEAAKRQNLIADKLYPTKVRSGRNN